MKYLAILLFWASTAFAQVDLSKGEVVGIGQCEAMKKSYPCFAVKLDGKLYVVLVDKKGQAYQVLVDKEGNAEVIYMRDSI